MSPCRCPCRWVCRWSRIVIAAVDRAGFKLTTQGPGHKVLSVMPDDAASFETHLGHLHPAVAGALRMIMAEVRELRQSVHLLTQGNFSMQINVDRTIAAARKLENAADAVVKVLNDTVANQRAISAQFAEAQGKLTETQTQLEAALAKVNTGSTVGAGELQATIDDLTRQLADARGQTDALGTAQSALDNLSDEMETRADAIAQAVVAGTPAATDGSAPQGGGVGQGERIPGAGATGLPPNTASNEGVQENLGNPATPANLPGSPAAGGPMSGVPTPQTDASSHSEPQSAPPVPPQPV